jgi:nucleoside-diphosphate-sugar epimerase
MHILFIGGTGNISSECARLLHRRGHRISVVSRGHRTVPEEFETITADRYDASAFPAAVADRTFDVVINFLGFHVPELELDFTCFRERVSQYLFISSATVYQKPPQTLPISESTPLGNPFSEYAREKQACEEWVRLRWEQDRFPVTVVRPSHTYGHTWLPNPVSSASYTVLGRMRQGKPVYVPDEGQSLWTLTACRDFAVGLAGLVGRSEAVGEAYHITSDEVLTWNQILREAARAGGVENPTIVPIPTDFICEVNPRATAGLKGDKSHHAVFDNAKIKAAVPDFQCATSLRQGLQESVAWFDADSSRQRIDPAIDANIERVIDAWAKHRL